MRATMLPVASDVHIVARLGGPPREQFSDQHSIWGSVQFVLTTNNIWGPVQFVLTTNNIWGTVQFVLTTNIIEELPIALGISAHTNIPINFPGSPYKFPIGRPLRFPACAGLVSYTFGSSSSELPLLPDGVQPRQSPWQNRMSVDTASSTLPPTRHSLTDPRQPRQKPHRYRRLPPSFHMPPALAGDCQSSSGKA